MGSFRIGISGSSGTGKSTLAKYVAKKLNLDVLGTKDFIREILKREDYDWSSGIQVERFLVQRNCQKEIADDILSLMDGVDTFVADRTVMDVAAYSIVELNDDIETVNVIVEECRKAASKYTHVFFCPWGILPLTPDGVRTLNPWYQFVIHSTILGLLKEWKIPYQIIEPADMNKRVENVLNIINK